MRDGLISISYVYKKIEDEKLDDGTKIIYDHVSAVYMVTKIQEKVTEFNLKNEANSISSNKSISRSVSSSTKKRQLNSNGSNKEQCNKRIQKHINVPKNLVVNHSLNCSENNNDDHESIMESSSSLSASMNYKTNNNNLCINNNWRRNNSLNYHSSMRPHHSHYYSCQFNLASPVRNQSWNMGPPAPVNIMSNIELKKTVSAYKVKNNIDSVLKRIYLLNAHGISNFVKDVIICCSR